MSRKPAATAMPLPERSNVAPFCRESGGDNVLRGARIRSRIAKSRGDALGDLDEGQDIESTSRTPVPDSRAVRTVGSELLLKESRTDIRTTEGFRDTVTNPDYVTADASLNRLKLAENAGVLELALDAADTIGAKNSLEKMLAHQMAVLHQQIMKTNLRLEAMNTLFPHRMPEQQRNVESCRLMGAMARLATAYQSGMLTLQRVRSAGRQTVVVKHTVQHVHVNQGGQAVVAGKMSKGGGGGKLQKSGRGSSRK